MEPEILQIVGVAGDAKLYGLADQIEPAVYQVYASPWTGSSRSPTF